jgi:uncharacterized membrane protein
MTEATPATTPPLLLHPRLVAPGAVLLIAAFVTDLVYSRTDLMQWQNFSIWLITVGLILALLSGLALLVDVVRHRTSRISWIRFIAFTAAALLSLLNAFIHSRDGYTAVVPQGLVLSALVAVILVVLGWTGWSVAVARTSSPASSQGLRS